MTLVVSDKINPRKPNQLHIIVNNNDYRNRRLSLYKVKINGQEREISSYKEWRSVWDSKAGTYHAKPAMDLFPVKTGDYEMSLLMFMDNKVVEFKKVNFKVEVPAHEVEALATYDRLKLFEYYRVCEKSSCKGVDFKKANDFSQQHPKSYLKNTVADICRKIVMKQLEGRMMLEDYQQRQIASLLKAKDNGELLKKLAYAHRYNKRDVKRKAIVEFWQEQLLDGLPVAPEDLQLSSSEKVVPYEDISMIFKWQGKTYYGVEKSLIDMKVNGERVTLPNRRGTTSSSSYMKINFRDFSYTRAGEYEIEASFSIGAKAYRFPKYTIKVEALGRDKEALRSLPIDDFKKCVQNGGYYPSSFSYIGLRKFVSRFPTSSYAEKINDALSSFPNYDVSASQSTLSEEERMNVVEILNLTGPAKAIANLQHIHSRTDKARRAFWLKHLKVHVSPAPAGLVCEIPKEITTFDHFKVHLYTPDGFGQPVSIAKIVIGDTKIHFSKKSKEQTFWWERTEGFPYKPGIYPLKVYLNHANGHWLLKESTIVVKPKSENKAAYELFCQSGIAEAVGSQIFYNIHGILDKKGMGKKIKDFVARYPDDPCTAVIANRFSHTLRYYWMSKMSDEQIAEYGDIVNLCAQAWANLQWDAAFPKASTGKKAIMKKLKKHMHEPQLLSLGKLPFTFKKSLLPYEQLAFKLKHDGRQIYESYIKVGGKKMDARAVSNKFWLGPDAAKEWHFEPQFYKRFPTEGEHDVEIKLNDFMKNYSLKSKIKIELPASEKKAYENLENSGILAYFSDRKHLLKPNCKLTTEPFVSFIKSFPKSAYVQIIKKRLVQDWYLGANSELNKRSTALLDLISIIDASLPTKLRQEQRKNWQRVK